MASNSEVGFGARLAAARTAHTHLQSFTTYVPPSTELSPSRYLVAINSLSTLNDQTVTANNAFRTAARIRNEHFFKTPTSVEKLLVPISAAVRSAFGKSSPQFTQVSDLITKIRGNRPPRTTAAAAEGAPDPVSQSERSYGSLAQSFADLVNTLSGFGTNYLPANPAITHTALQDKLTAINAANTAVANTYGALKTKRDGRLAGFGALSNTTTRIKDSVQSQYGRNSSEHSLLKSLKV